MHRNDYADMTSGWIFIAQSKINGLGLFSRRTIPKGNIAGTFTGAVLSVANKRTIQVDRHRHICSHYIDFINHNCHPNTYVRAESNAIVLYAIKPIESQSDEITIDYNCSEYWLAESFACRCCEPPNSIYGYRYLVDTDQSDYLRRINGFTLPHLVGSSSEGDGL
ncbi:SET domain-containing protein [Bradyrhizobium sp. 30]|nr:SET domain-containing protein [Bradyrhizobium sp. 30]